MHWSLVAVHKKLGTIDDGWIRRQRSIKKPAGLFHRNYGAAAESAKSISLHKDIDRVVVIRVVEEAEGVWRNGTR